MITNNQIATQLKKDGLNLSETECNLVRLFFIKMAQLEIENFKNQKKDNPQCQVNEIKEIGKTVDNITELKNAA
jgi:hypothetical protein